MDNYYFGFAWLIGLLFISMAVVMGWIALRRSPKDDVNSLPSYRKDQTLQEIESKTKAATSESTYSETPGAGLSRDAEPHEDGDPIPSEDPMRKRSA